MLRIFKLIAFLEGISYLLLFANMLLLKPTFFEVYKQLLYPIGMSHGGIYWLRYFIKKNYAMEYYNLFYYPYGFITSFCYFFYRQILFKK